MEVRLLGPVELRAAGRTLPLGGPRQRSVLAVLAADAGRPVPVDTLIDRVWGDAPPRQVRKALQVYIARLRRLLARYAREMDGTAARVVRRAGGYALEVGTDCVDAFRFQRLLEHASKDGCPDPRRVRLLRQALDLWRGPALADLSGDWAALARQAWWEQYLDAVLAWAHACLRVGDPGAVLARLTTLTGEHPLAESLAAMVMRALCAAGRPAEALAHYDTLRRLLARELGTDPSAELQQLHRQILQADPTLVMPVAASPPGSPPVPRQLPAVPSLFTGRAGELAMLDRVPDPATMVVVVISGMAGVGKTALALHAAHLLADRYPDGQLFIDLHGYTQGLEPIEPDEALDHMLRALGVPGTHIPATLDERAALYRTRLADQQVLIVLDNAATETQVQPLLPGAAGCLALVTGRRRLAGLDHTHMLSLDTMPTPEAVTLLVRTAGQDCLTDQPPELVAETVELCGRLPLAIRIAAAWLASHSSWSVAELAERLRDQDQRLVELGDGSRSVAAALELSYQQLFADQQHMYRLLGIHPGSDVDPYAAAALADATIAQARRLLDQLLYAHLLLEPTPGRYVFHDLVRAHATSTAARDEAEPARRAALSRLLDHYRHTASVAMDTAYAYERERRPRVPPAGTPTPDLPGPNQATVWLDTELPNLLAAARYATEHGNPVHVLHLSTILHRHLRSRSHLLDADALHHQALTTARATGHQAYELDALTGLGWVHLRRAQYQQAADHFGQAL